MLAFNNDKINWNNGIEKGKIIPTKIKDFINFLNYFLDILNMDISVFHGNVSDSAYINRKNPITKIPKIFKLDYNEYLKENKHLKDFAEGKWEKPYTKILENYIPNLFYIFGKMKNFHSILQLYYENQIPAFKNIAKAKSFENITDKIKWITQFQKTKYNFDDLIVTAIEELDEKYQYKFGRMPTAGNLTWSCLKIDNYKLSVTTYEKIKNTLSLKIQREAGLFGTKLFKLVNVMTKAISIKPTGIFQDWMASDTNSNENYSGYLFNNGYFDLLRLQFREQKQNCWKSFDYDFNTEYDEKNISRI